MNDDDFLDCDFEISEKAERDSLKNLATFCLKVQIKYLSPASTIQGVLIEFEELHEVSQSILQKNVTENMQLLDSSVEMISTIKDGIVKNDLFSECNTGPLKAVQKRNTFAKKMSPLPRPLKY